MNHTGCRLTISTRRAGDRWTVTAVADLGLSEVSFPSQQQAWEEAVRRARVCRGVAELHTPDGTVQRVSYGLDDLQLRRRQALRVPSR